ncbi:Glutamate dehydrogenase [Hondaea fermentalgiana]|uniref:glutamate dehydrogenase (NADP(+)) n=1 Tax=Hondaea fermentalgiana TaxID=2315210 RepID=A0A2R5GKF4_9STRA|nr:Glutamate dehydrogenase [Hondaea fermentalgiana]|eukprot:GBG31392.1 Glutamate dehydrogenase [Hondaea fermentalgiana]
MVTPQSRSLFPLSSPHRTAPHHLTSHRPASLRIGSDHTLRFASLRIASLHLVRIASLRAPQPHRELLIPLLLHPALLQLRLPAGLGTRTWNTSPLPGALWILLACSAAAVAAAAKPYCDSGEDDTAEEQEHEQRREEGGSEEHEQVKEGSGEGGRMPEEKAMSDADFKSAKEFIEALEKKNPGEGDFVQAMGEIVESVWDWLKSDDGKPYLEANILSRFVEPERVVMFRVVWQDDDGATRVNRGYRVQFNSACGPYKGGLRFHPSVTLDILKFLGAEQVLKNRLTGLPIGGGKGGSDFNPKGKSDNEVMRFCQAFMTEMFRHIGPNTDVPAGDIGVAGREVGFLFGMYKKLHNRFEGILTGKPALLGGSNLRPEATGYGVVYFADAILRQAQSEDSGDESPLKGLTVAASGSGNVAIYLTQKLIELGAKVVTLSDSSGSIYDKEGIDDDKLEFIMDLKLNRRGRMSEYADKYDGVEYMEGERPWSVKCDIAFPCATQNELEKEDAEKLVENGVKCVCEGANMPSTPEAIEVFQSKKVLFGPAKAANAGGVGVSALEMSQNSMRLSWSREEVDEKLHSIMKSIHETCVENGKVDGEDHVDYVKGANLGAFRQVAEAMYQQGAV